jgi:vacuolar-type H+-ATPase catalytic subunit A/Vma1
MQVTGKIVKVAGPLIIAEGMAGAKMYDVVRVSDKQLIGEIIEMRGDRAWIQVYEDTGGLGPGEPVESTGHPLSVELGPGLIGAIYDGIQRPLDSIFEKIGDRISRGVTAPALDRERKWHFVPSLEAGANVQAGDILGTVQETDVIVHKVMVPPGVEGTVEEISQGDYSVTETVAKISTPGGTENVAMLQMWPVRQGRPYKEKLTPSEPLISGQRVIDTFFPVAKGGTAAIPGPFGSGKCVSGATPVMLADGTLITMEELYREGRRVGKVTSTGIEETVELDRDLEVIALKDQGLLPAKVNLLYRGKSDSLLRLRTRTGKVLEVTPVHKLFQLTERAEITETQARKLRVGDYLVSSRKLPSIAGQKDLKINLPGDVRFVDEDLRSEMSQQLRKLRKDRRIDEIDLNKDTVQSIISKRVMPSIAMGEQVFAAVGMAAPIPVEYRGARWGQVVNMPQKLTGELAELMGLFIAEGYLRDEGTIVFTNSEHALRQRFLELVDRVFKVRGTIEWQNGKTPNVLVHNRVLVKTFRALELDGKADSKKLPGEILKGDEKALGAFLRGYFLGDGSFTKGELELRAASRQLQLGLSYAFARLGILHTLAGKEGRWRIFVRGLDNLRLFLAAVGTEEFSHRKLDAVDEYLKEKKTSYTALDVVPLSGEFVEEIYKKSNVSYSALREAGVEIHNYTGGERMSSPTFRKFAGVMAGIDQNIDRLATLMDDVYCDEIVEIEELSGPHHVYDLTVPQHHNFVGGFGASILHNTVVQHQLAKWSDADLIVYIGCGERGNEMTDVLREFPELVDPRTGEPLMKRTVLVANTSDMPVAAREASIYTGITIAEYFRDMGYHVALMADSTSRWAEALREMSGRLEEMPGEEGYPAYLGSRLAEFYERTGKVVCLGQEGREATLTAIGAVSPPGGDLSEPVTQATLRIVKVFWGLDANLAYRRHFPAINWLISYSLYTDQLKDYFAQEVGDEALARRDEALKILQQEAELEEIVRLVGEDALSYSERMVLATARSLREDFLHQVAYHEVDTYTPLAKQAKLLELILKFHHFALEAVEQGVELEKVLSLPVRERIGRAKYIPVDKMAEMDQISSQIEEEIRGAGEGERELA